MDLNELEKRLGDIVERQMNNVLSKWHPDDVWVKSKLELEKELGWGRSIVEQIFNDPDLSPAIVTYGPRKVNVNVTLLRRLIKKKYK